MAFQADKPQEGSQRGRKSFIPAPKIYSKSVPATTTTETPVEVKEKKFVPGDRVCISGIKKGVVLYFGKLHVSDGLWCGIELDDPEGLNDGQIESVRYFSCKPSHGIFAPLDKVELVQIAGKSYTTWAKVSSVPEKRADSDGDKSPLKITYETLEDGILEEQPPFDISGNGRKSALPRSSLKQHHFELPKVHQNYQQQQQQQQQQPSPQQQQSQQPQPPYPQYQYFPYPHHPTFSQPQYTQQQYPPQQYPPQQPPQHPSQQQISSPQYPSQQQQPSLQPQYPLQLQPPYPQQYPCQQLQPPYPNQQTILPAQQQYPQQPSQLQQQQQQQYHQQLVPTVQQYHQQVVTVVQQQTSPPQPQPPPPQQQQYHQQLVSTVQQPTSQHQTQPSPYHQQVGPTIQQPYQQYQQLAKPPIQDQHQQQQQCQPGSPKHSSIYPANDKPLDGYNPDGGGSGGSDGSGNGNVQSSVQNQTDIEFSASVKEYLESDRRTYFNFTFDGDSGSSRSASTIPDSLTSSAYQAAEQELDPVGAIWELENTDDEVSFRLEEAASESSSLTASTEEKQLIVKLENDANTNNSNSQAPPTGIEQESTEKILIQHLEKEMQDNIAKKDNYYKSLARQSSSERDVKESVVGQGKEELKSRSLNSDGANQVFNNILDSGYEPDTIKQQPTQIHNSHLDNSLNESIAPPIMTDSGIIVKEDPEPGSSVADVEQLGVLVAGINMDHLSPNDQLAVDLRNGHKDKARPISLISTTSVDTGYVPDTDSEVGTVMNSPVEKIDRTIVTNCEPDGEVASTSIQQQDNAEPKKVDHHSEFIYSKDGCNNGGNNNDDYNDDSEIPKANDYEIESDNKDVERQEGHNDSDGSSNIDQVKDCRTADISKQERDSSSQEKDRKQKKQEAPKDGPATKSKKNATNKEKAVSSSTDTGRARSKSADRKTEQEKAKSFLSETKSKQEKVVPKLIKREKPKSKWDKIMNKIETNKENVKLKPKAEVKSKLESYLSQKPVTPAIEKKPAKETPPKKLTHIPLPDYSKVKSKLFSATASSATKQRQTNHKRSDVENVLQEMSEEIGSSTVSINSVVSSKSNQSVMGTSGNQTPGKANLLQKQMFAKPEKGKIRSKVDLIKTERPGSASSSRTDATQNSVKSMNVKNVGRLQTTEKNVNAKSSTQIYQSKVSDQNKLNNNRTTPKSKVVSSSKTPSTDRAPQAAKEISRLEALCEHRTKDLNYTKLQLKSTLTAFDAMAALVNYLSYDLNAFSCPSLKAKLEDVQKDLDKAENQIERLRVQQIELEQEIMDCNRHHEQALTDLVNAQSTSLLNQKELLTKKNTDIIKKTKDDHVKEVERMKRLQAETKIDMTAEHKNNLDNLRLSHLQDIRNLQRKHENQMEDLHRQHRDKLEAITHTFESIKMTLSEKVESLRCECEEFRQRARMCEEALEQEANVRVQTALSPYRDLPREIESLKTVLEMRNQEIHDLRNQKIEFEKQLEELPPALEKITLLQQKIENLEAILQIKSDHEKQLNEKCQSLMRKFNKETRANKRMSMEFDELKWRMSQSELSGSQENILKMYSCSPSGSESGSPDPTRRFSRSPKHWDHRDGGGDQLSSSVTGDGSMESKVKRRSGTFIVHDRPSPLSSPKSKTASGSPAIQMSQSWAGTGESATSPSPEDSKLLTLSPPMKSLTPPENSLSFLEISTSSVTEQPTLPLVNPLTEAVSAQERVANDENK